MNAFIQFFYTILYQPLLNLLILLYVYLPGHDLGVAVIILTLAIKFILHPLSAKGMRSQKAMLTLQPKIKELQNRYKDDRAQQSKSLMELYKKEKISPMAGCLPLIIQLPIIIALYKVFLGGLEVANLKTALYTFVPNPGVISTTFLGFFSLESKAFIIAIAVLAGIAQFAHAKLSAVKKQPGKRGAKDFAGMMQSQMLYVFPLLTVFIIYKFGAVIGLYWLVSTVFSVVEQYLVNKKYDGQKITEKS